MGRRHPQPLRPSLPARSRRLRQVEIDMLCLEVFGFRYLPADMAHRIAARREALRFLAEYAEKSDRSHQSGGRRKYVSVRRRSFSIQDLVEAVAV